jgi:hypothetical protein
MRQTNSSFSSAQRKVVYALSGVLVVYVALTVMAFIPVWESFDGPARFSVVKNGGIAALLAVMLHRQPRIICWATLAWCVATPWTRYVMLIEDIREGVLDSMNVIDAIRISFMFIAAGLSAVLAYLLFNKRNASKSA